MTIHANPIRKIFSRFFPRKYVISSQENTVWSVLTEKQKKELAHQNLVQGEIALLQGNLLALQLFETATQLEPNNPQIWYRQGLAFFEYGSEEGKEKALLLASKYFKYTTQIHPEFFEAWVAWGNTLLQLGRFHKEHHFHLEAKEKYQKALSLDQKNPDILSEVYWDYGIVWTEIASYSGEAHDLKLAIDSFETSLKLHPNPPPEFFNDFGKAYLELGLLVNDSRLYFQAASHMIKAVEMAPHYFDGWVSLAENYSQLYVNTVDEKYIAKASHAYNQALKISTKTPDVWLSFAQILAESGRINEDAKLLRQSIENCARAALLDSKDPLIIAQWVESLSYLGIVTGRLDLLIEAEQKILKATDTFPDDPDLWHAYGICLCSLGRYYEDPDYFEIAIEKIQYGLSIDRSSAEHWHTLGCIHQHYADLVQQEDLQMRATRFFAKAIDLKPSCPSILFDAAKALLDLSEMTHDLPSLEKAITHFETLLQNHKEVILHHPEWLVKYARALDWLSEFSNEESHLKKALEILLHVILIEPDFPHIHHYIAECYMSLGTQTLDAEYYKKALPFFRLALRHDEENENIWLDFGICLIHLAEQTFDPDFQHQFYQDAEQKISKAGVLGHPGAHYHLACLYSLLGKTDIAMRLIHQSLAARTLPPIHEMLDDDWLENLRDTEVFTQFVNDLEAKLQAREQ